MELVRQCRSQAPAVTLEAAQQPAHRPAGNLNAEMVRRHILDMVCFVQDQPLVGWKHCGFLPVIGRLTDCKVSGEQMVVDHDHVCLCGPAASPKQEAAIEVGTLEPSTQIGFGTD